MGFLGDPMVGLLFPGQGSQHVGMGADLAREFPAARQAFEEADDVLGFSLSRLAWNGPEADLTATLNAQPAILAHSVAVHRVLAGELGDVGLAAGHSLGEFSAHVAAGTVQYGNALAVVRRRGELMFRSGTERPGTMAAIVGMDDEAVERLCAEASSGGGACVAANYNSPGQVVISGDEPSVARAVQLARDAGARRAIPLNVSGAFHSPLMGSAEAGLRAALEDVELETPRFPVVSNVTAAPVSDPAEIRRLLVAQLTSPVRWAQGVRAMISAGVTGFLELGPGSVLTGLLKRIDRSASGRAIGTPDDVRSLVPAP